MKLLNRNNLAVRFAASKKQSRHTLAAILATENETVATDGHILARVSLPDVKPEHFPSIAGFKPNGFTRGLIPLDAAKDIEGSIPKDKHMPALNYAAISAKQVEDRTVLEIASTDLQTPKVFTVVLQPDGSFPEWERSFPAGNAAMDICLDAALLASVAQAAAKFSNQHNKPVRLRFYGPNSAVRFDLVNDDGQEMNVLLMPCRATITPTFGLPNRKPLQSAPEPTPEQDATR